MAFGERTQLNKVLISKFKSTLVPYYAFIRITQFNVCALKIKDCLWFDISLKQTKIMKKCAFQAQATNMSDH